MSGSGRRGKPVAEPVGTSRPRAGCDREDRALVADPRADEIRAEDGRVVKLEPLKMRLLMALAERPGEVVSTQELLDTVWSGLIVTSGSVYQGVAQLRRVLGDGVDKPVYIETVPRKGYRLVAPVQRLARSSAAPAVVAPDLPPPSSPLPSQDAAVEAGPLPAVMQAADSSWRLRRRWLLAAGAAGAAGVATWRFVEMLPPSLPVRIAVLPFSDRTRGETEPALSQGLALDVIRVLARYPHVDVVAPDSVLAIADPAQRHLAEVAQRLRVGFVLLGELVRSGARVHVAVQLLALPASGCAGAASSSRRWTAWRCCPN